jgi:hypothetical protein
MRSILTALCLLTLAGAAVAGPVLPDSLLRPGLEAAWLSADELSCYPESHERDPFRLNIVDAIMARPTAADSLLPRLEAALFAAPVEEDPLGAPDLSFLTRLGRWLHEDLASKPDAPWEDARIDLLVSHGDRPLEPARYFHGLMSTLIAQRRHALGDLDTDELSRLVAESPALLEETGGGDSVSNPIALRRAEDAESERINGVLELWTRVDRSLLYRMGLRFLRDGAWYARILATETYLDPERRPEPLPDTRHEFPDGSVATGELLYAASGPWGNLVVGAEGENHYRGDFLFLLDLGGDDLYRLGGNRPDTPADLAGGDGFRCLVDLAGEDRYEAQANFALAGSFLGAALLDDESGNDSYRARDFDLGCGWLGTAVLVDRAGDDLYAGGTAVMGAGGGGLGLLRDNSGGDVYRAELYAQGFAWVGGCGVLEDREGGDVYAVLPTYTDILRYEDHSLTLSQGFSIGARPRYSGGLGILRDATGNDSYLADIYGQGSGYWFALGLLHDEAGNDSYDAYQYAQGAGIHLALGFLLDDAGNDSYSSHGVGQGCGHDLAFGLLRDGGGNDRYACDDLSQGAGSANGIGMLLDTSGLDGYLAKSKTAPAYGNPRRHFGSIGLLVDGSGEDWFSAPGVPGERRGSLEGTLLDRDVAIAGPLWDPGEATPYRSSAWTMEEYFLMASSGEPRFREWQAAGMDSLTANPEAAIAALIPHFDTEVARRRHRIKDALKTIGKPAVDPLRLLLREGPPASWRQAVWCLENIGDAAAFPELMTLLSEPRNYRDEVSALAALARLADLPPAPARILERACEQRVAPGEGHPFVRKELAYLIGRQFPERTDLLLVLAADPHYAPRWMARRALAQRENWGPAFRRAWRAALRAPQVDTASRLARLLTLRSARETASLLGEARRSRHHDDPAFGRALDRALADHPERESRLLRHWLGKLN